MRRRRLRSGVYWQGALKQKGVKQGLHVLFTIQFLGEFLASVKTLNALYRIRQHKGMQFIGYVLPHLPDTSTFSLLGFPVHP